MWARIHTFSPWLVKWCSKQPHHHLLLVGNLIFHHPGTCHCPYATGWIIQLLQKYEWQRVMLGNLCCAMSHTSTDFLIAVVVKFCFPASVPLKMAGVFAWPPSSVDLAQHRAFPRLLVCSESAAVSHCRLLPGANRVPQPQDAHLWSAPRRQIGACTPAALKWALPKAMSFC